jgi:hypothetical protein
MPYWTEAVKGAASAAKERQAREAEREALDRKQMQDILKAAMEGTIEQAPAGEGEIFGPPQRARGGLGRTLLENLGVAPPKYEQGVGYRRVPGAVSEQEMKRELLKREYETAMGVPRAEGARPTGVTPTARDIVPALTGAPTAMPTPTEEAPQQFIQIQDGVDKYGNPKLKTVKNPEYERWVSTQQKAQEGRLSAKAEILKLGEKAKANFKSAVSMFSGVVAQSKAQREEQEGLGLLPGIKGRAGVITKRPEYARTAAAYGQRVETAMRMNSILTGQNRVIRGVVNMIFNSLPDPYDPEETVAAKLAQSITNAYKITKAWERAGLSPEQLKGAPTSKMKIGNKTVEVIDVDIPPYTLMPDEQAEVNSIIDDVLATPAMAKRKLIDRGTTPAKVAPEDEEYQKYLRILEGR